MGDYISGSGFRIVGAGVASGPQYLRAGKSGIPEFVKEGVPFLGSGDSREPVECGPLLVIHRFVQYDLTTVKDASGPDDSGQISVGPVWLFPNADWI